MDQIHFRKDSIGVSKVARRRQTAFVGEFEEPEIQPRS